MASFESLSDAELRKKLLDFGYDLPVSINRDFLVKKLTKITQQQQQAQSSGNNGSTGNNNNIRRKSTPVASSRSSVPPTVLPATPTPKKNSRLSLNETGARARLASSEQDIPIPAVARARKSLPASTRSSASPAKSTSSRSSTPNSTKSSKPPLRQSLSQQLSTKLNRVVEEPSVEDGESEEEEDEDEGVEEDIQAAGRTSNFISRTFGSPQQAPVNNYRERGAGDGLRNRIGGAGDALPTKSGPYNNRYESYVSFFRGERDQPAPPTRRSEPAASSPYLNRKKYDDSGDEDEDDEVEEGEIRESRVRKVLSAMNPINWVRGRNFTFGWPSSSSSTETAEAPAVSMQQTENYALYTRPTYPVSAGLSSARYSMGANGNWGSTTAPSNLANRIYSPAAPPPTVPPAIAARRQAGFKAFFSRGERNGYEYGNNTGTTDWASSSHLISKILLVVFLLGFACLGGLYYYKSTVLLESHKGQTDPGKIIGNPKTGVNFQKKLAAATVMVYPICGLEGVPDDGCIPKEHVKNSRILFNVLKDELVQRARIKGCGWSDVEDELSLPAAKNLLFKLVNLKKAEIEDSFKGLLMLIAENPGFGLRIRSSKDANEEEDEITARTIGHLDPGTALIYADGVSLDMICLIWTGLYSLAFYFVIFACASGLGYFGWKALNYYKGRKAREEHEIYEMVEKIMELLYQQYEQSLSSGAEAFVAVNHLRDELLSPRDRKKKEALWNQVVQHISTNESRVREEIQHISGEDFRVWRWIHSASPVVSKKMAQPNSIASNRQSLSANNQSPSNSGLYPSLGNMRMEMDNRGDGAGSSSKWQGQAFEICDGSPNSIAVVPTTCLKIRQMFDASKGYPEVNKIERAIIEKCKNSKILHIGMDTDLQEGAVYVRCMSNEDAKGAYFALHGWWYEGHLLSVKFLREERYLVRFPDSKNITTPITLNS